MMTSNLHQAQSHDILRSWQSQRNDINHHKDFVLPMFIGQSDDSIEPIESMPETYRYGCNTAIDYLTPLVDTYGLRAVLLFPVVTKTDSNLQIDDDDDDDEEDSPPPSSSVRSSSSSSSACSEGDKQGTHHLLDEDSTPNNNNNPFLNAVMTYSPTNDNEDEERLIANDQQQQPQQQQQPVAPSPQAPITSQVRDIKLIKGMALKDRHNPVLRLIPKLRARFPQLLIICDVCLCAFTSTGHCCLFEDHDRAKHNNRQSTTNGSVFQSMFPPISNNTTCQYLAMLAVEYARRGCDVVAPSDMMDGRILTIRERLNDNGLNHVSILSYSAKFASAYYGPFRQATNNAPEFGDRRTYQLPPGSRALATKAVQRDISQGADMVMVKPGGLYLDIVRDIRERHSDIPVAIYQVSGEYSMLKLAAKEGLIDLKLAVAETLTAFRRAGATIIITYFTPEILRGELF